MISDDLAGLVAAVRNGADLLETARGYANEHRLPVGMVLHAIRDALTG